MKNKIALLITLLSLALMGLVMFGAIMKDSPTSDEPPHLLSGYVFVRYGDDFIDVEHPLLAKGLAGLPLLFTDTQMNLDDPNYSQQKDQSHVGHMFAASRDFLNYNGNDPAELIFWGRLPMLLLTLAFGFVIFLLGSKLFGPWAGALATFFYATEPLILANGPLINTDLAATGFVITTVYALILYAEKQSWQRLLFLILAVAGAFLSKFSTFYLFPIVLGLMLYINKVQGTKRWKDLFILVFGVAGTIWLFYGFIGFRDRGLGAFIPTTYLVGLIETFKAVSTTKRFTYLLGESYVGSRIYYFPILILVKTQLLTLLGAALAGFYFLRSKMQAHSDYFWRKELVLPKLQLVIFFTPLIIFLGLALISKFNIGLRHAMPIYPFLFILAAAGFVALIHNIRGLFHKTGALVATLVILLIIVGGRAYSLASTYPHFLSYYNFSVGTDNGWKVANDANYDWGQDIGRLADYVRENNIEMIALDNYTGLYAAEDYYKLPVTKISPKDTGYKGYLALSTSVITFHEDKADSYSWVIDNYKPIARAGKSIFIFKLE